MIREYTEEKSKLSYYMPQLILLKNNILLNKNGTLQKIIKFRGNDLNNCTKEELILNNSKLNNVLKRLENRWSLHIETRREKTKKYLTGNFSELAGKLIDLERQKYFNGDQHFESKNYMSITYLLPEDVSKKMGEILIENSDEKVEKRDYVEEFRKEFLNILDLLKSVFLEVEELNEDEIYTYLHGCVSNKEHDIVKPSIPMYISNYLCDSFMTGGLEPKLGDKYIKCISLQGFPHYTYPSLFDDLNLLNIEYRWVTRFLALGKVEAMALLNKTWKKWFTARFSIIDMLKQQITGQAPEKEDISAVKKAIQVEVQQEITQSDVVGQGYYTCTIILSDENLLELERKVRAVEEVINKKGFTTINETVNCVESFLGAIPGNISNNIRLPIINSLTLSHLLPTSNIWAGEEYIKVLSKNNEKAPALIYTQTDGSTPFRFNLHIGDVGHTIIVGKTGAGKSVLLGTIASQFRKYEDSQVFFFDKDRSSLVLTKLMGGKFYDLGNDDVSFQPLRNINDEKELEWANNWILDIFEQEHIEITAEIKSKTWQALTLVSKVPAELRTMSTLKSYINERELKNALTQYTKEGSLGRYFDNNSDNIEHTNWQVFERGQIVGNKQAIQPILDFLFHRVENLISEAKPSIIILDECWLFLDNPKFASKIRDWLKTLRKKNTSVVFATQELTDIRKSSIADTIISACDTKVFLANDLAETEQYRDTYKSFNLNSREIEIIANATMKRDYYYKSTKGSRLFDLKLKNIGLAFLTSTSLEDQNIILNLEKECGTPEELCYKWLDYKKVDRKIIDELLDNC